MNVASGGSNGDDGATAVSVVNVASSQATSVTGSTGVGGFAGSGGSGVAGFTGNGGASVVTLATAAASFTCRCSSAQVDYWYQLHGATASNACAYTIAACLEAPPFEAGDHECMQIFEDHGVDACGAESACVRDAVLGDVKLTESSNRSVGCRPAAGGFVCECSQPTAGTRFDVPSGDSASLCLDARGWCAGEDLVVTGSRECAPSSVGGERDACVAVIECKEAVVASGVDATRYETFPMRCENTGDGALACACPSLGSFVIPVEDSQSNCWIAAEMCAREQ